METEETDTVAICPIETNVPSIECHTNISHSRCSELNSLLKFAGMDMKGCTHKYVAFGSHCLGISGKQVGGQDFGTGLLPTKDIK